MNELQIFNNAEFGQLRTLVKDNETWFVGKDVCEILKYQNGSRDINRHVDEEDRQILKSTKTVVLENGIPARGLTIINESGLYSLVLSSKLPNAKKFKRWVTSEVLPSIRKHGIYATTQTIETMLADPDNAIRMLTALKEERAKRIEQEKQIATLTAENQMQAQMISEFKPKVEYNDQWILYKEQMNKGYTKSETIDITRSDGRVEAKMYTKWTQKGRLKIHEILTQLGFVANFDREQQALFN